MRVHEKKQSCSQGHLCPGKDSLARPLALHVFVLTVSLKLPGCQLLEDGTFRALPPEAGALYVEVEDLDFA